MSNRQWAQAAVCALVMKVSQNMKELCVWFFFFPLFSPQLKNLDWRTRERWGYIQYRDVENCLKATGLLPPSGLNV